jgi:TorA maturation chaperone TorD
MRHLISEQKRELEEQKAFFERWIWPNVRPLCAAIEKADGLAFYKRVARLLLEVCTLEHRAFEML